MPSVKNEIQKSFLRWTSPIYRHGEHRNDWWPQTNPIADVYEKTKNQAQNNLHGNLAKMMPVEGMGYAVAEIRSGEEGYISSIGETAVSLSLNLGALACLAGGQVKYAVATYAAAASFFGFKALVNRAQIAAAESLSKSVYP